jgi:hypothetical protein
LLRKVAVDGADVGEAMIAAGLAREYGSRRRGGANKIAEIERFVDEQSDDIAPVVRQIISALGSVSIGLLLAAAGLYFDVRTLTVGGVIIAGVATVLWIYEWARSKAHTPQEVDASERQRKRDLIDRGRSLAATYTQGRAGGMVWRDYLERTATYAALRGHLSRDYLEKLNAARVAYARGDGANYEPLVEWFLDDLDRLEREWKLR